MDAELEARLAKLETKVETLDAKYTEKAKGFREWIVANPLKAARVIGTVCVLVGYAAGRWLPPVKLF